jgi:superoxide dismutase, Cu-Zn family
MILATVLGVSAAFAADSYRGSAIIKGTAEGSAISGEARFEDTKAGLKVSVTIKGVSDGDHALHLHEFGDCGDAGRAAGGHYNPEGHQHGDALKAPKKAHGGDLGNAASKDGTIVFEAVLPRVTLSKGKRGAAGRSIVLHEKADDFTQPAGNAGGRIACGSIVLVGK